METVYNLSDLIHNVITFVPEMAESTKIEHFNVSVVPIWHVNGNIWLEINFRCCYYLFIMIT